MHFLINSYQKCIEQYLDSTNVVRKKINILVNEHEYEEVGMKIDMIYVANDITLISGIRYYKIKIMPYGVSMPQQS